MNSDSGSTLFAGSSPNFSHFVKLCEEIRITKSKNIPSSNPVPRMFINRRIGPKKVDNNVTKTYVKVPILVAIFDCTKIWRESRLPTMSFQSHLTA